MINHAAWLHERILSSQSKSLRMPLLCALNKSLAAPILSEGWNEITRGLNTHYYQLDKNETYITSIALTNDSIIAMGSGNPKGDLYFIKENAMNKENETSSSRFHEIYHSQIQRPIYSLDWAQHHLLVGSNDGKIQLYDTQHLDLDGQPQDQLEIICEYQSQLIPTDFSAPPGKCAPNSHVNTVSFSPTYAGRSLSNGNNNSFDRSTHFLTTAANHVEVWDVNYSGNTSLHALAPDDSCINTAHWSSLSSSLIATGGEAGYLYVVDLRVKENQGIVWKALEGHSGAPIRDVQFNPFIPYWLASGGDDSIVNIWDLRATCRKPLAKIDGHHAPISSISWANVRPEKLATTSRDGTFRIWSLSGSTIPIWDSYYQLVDSESRTKGELPQLEEHWWPQTTEVKVHSMDENFGIIDSDMLSPEDNTMVPTGAFGIGAWGKLQIGPLYYGDLHKHSKGPVVKVLVSNTRPGLFYCATSSGQLCSQIFRPTTRGALDYPHRYDFEKDPLCYTIDNAIHYRHINVANNLIENLKEMPMKNDEQKRIRDERIKNFEDCLILRPPIQENDWKMDSIPVQDGKRLWTDADMWQCALDTFRKDLDYWRTRLAPGCENIFGDIPLDTGDLHPRLSSQLMKGVDFTLSNSNPTFPWDQAILPSSPTIDDVSTRQSQPGVEAISMSQAKKNLRRSSTTPNLTSDDLLTTYTDLKNLNERNSSGTVLNTGANWTPLQRAKTTVAHKQPKQLTRQPSLSAANLKSIFTKSSKRLETPLKLQNRSPVRQGSPLSQQEILTSGQSLKQPHESSSHQHTPVSLRDEFASGQETPSTQQDTLITRQSSSPTQQISQTVAQNEPQQKEKISLFARQDTSRGKNSRLPSRRKKKQSLKQHQQQQQQQRDILLAQQKTPPSPTQPNMPSPIQHEESHQRSENLHVNTTDLNKQYVDTAPATNTYVSSPQQLDIKSIIKYGSFGQPAANTATKSTIGTSASTSNLSATPNINSFKQNMSSDALVDNMMTTNTSDNRASDNLDEPMDYSSELGATNKESSQVYTSGKVDDDTERPHLSRQHATLLAPAKSLRRAFTKKLRRKKTNSSSSSSISAYNAADRDPQHHRQQPQPDISRPSSRNAL